MIRIVKDKHGMLFYSTKLILSLFVSLCMYEMWSVLCVCSIVCSVCVCEGGGDQSFSRIC